MRKTMNIWVLIAMSACVLVAFFWYSGTLSQTIDELNDTYDQTQMRLTQLQGDQADLKTQLETVGTDAFIENQARTMYRYMARTKYLRGKAARVFPFLSVMRSTTNSQNRYKRGAWNAGCSHWHRF